MKTDLSRRWWNISMKCSVECEQDNTWNVRSVKTCITTICPSNCWRFNCLHLTYTVLQNMYSHSLYPCQTDTISYIIYYHCLVFCWASEYYWTNRSHWLSVAHALTMFSDVSGSFCLRTQLPSRGNQSALHGIWPNAQSQWNSVAKYWIYNTFIHLLDN